MDINYDLVQAGKSLARYTTERVDDPRSMLQMLKMFNNEGEDDNSGDFVVVEINKLGRLVFKNNTYGECDSEASEVVVGLQGIITAKELPPFKGRINPTKLSYYRQGVTIAIVDNDTVDKVLNQIAQVQHLFKRFYGDRHQDSCGFVTFVNGAVGYTSIDISNRLVKKKNEGDEGQMRAFGPGIDPDGQIEAAASANGFVHTTDNEVHFFQRKKDAKGDHQFVVAEPTVFQIGDIVEVQASFVALPLHQRKTRLTMILRSVGLIDAKYSKACAVDRFKQAARSVNGQRAMLKRSIGYAEENLSIVQSRMSLNDTHKAIRSEDKGDKDGAVDGDNEDTVYNDERADKKRR